MHSLARAWLGWTDDNVATTKRLFLEGKSATEISGVIHAPTRNAVIGKLHRLGLTKSDKPRTVAAERVPRAPRPRVAPPPPATSARAPVMPRVEASPIPIFAVGDIAERPTLVQLQRRGCRWPLGETTGAEQRFCGCPQASDDGPYCLEHASNSRKPVSGAKALTTSLRRYI